MPTVTVGRNVHYHLSRVDGDTPHAAVVSSIGHDGTAPTVALFVFGPFLDEHVFSVGVPFALVTDIREDAQAEPGEPFWRWPTML